MSQDSVDSLTPRLLELDHLLQELQAIKQELMQERGESPSAMAALNPPPPAPAVSNPVLSCCMVCASPIPQGAHVYICPTSAEHSQCRSCFLDYVRHCCNNYTEGKFPMKCPVPSCKHPVTDAQLRSFVFASPASQELWESYERAQLQAALMLEMRSGEVAVTCPKCNHYAEIFPHDYQAQASELIKSLNAAKAEEERRKEREQFAKLHPSVPPAPPVDSAVTLKNFRENQRTPKPAATTAPQTETEEAKSDTPIIDHFKPNEQLTTQFFQCKTLQCGVSVCLNCNVFMAEKEQPFHICPLDRATEIYQELLQVLAEQACQRCPKCNRVGRKDLACTHITCDAPCRIRWCYVCAKIPNWNDHNKWSPKSFVDTCPHYLQSSYGDVLKVDRSGFEGDAQKALNFFHLMKQVQAVREYRKKLNNEQTWATVMAKFPGGIFSEEETTAVEKREELFQSWVELSRKEQEEARRLAEEARTMFASRREELNHQLHEAFRQRALRSASVSLPASSQVPVITTSEEEKKVSSSSAATATVTAAPITSPQPLGGQTIPPAPPLMLEAAVSVRVPAAASDLPLPPPPLPVSSNETLPSPPVPPISLPTFPPPLISSAPSLLFPPALPEPPRHQSGSGTVVARRLTRHRVFPAPPPSTSS